MSGNKKKATDLDFDSNDQNETDVYSEMFDLNFEQDEIEEEQNFQNQFKDFDNFSNNEDDPGVDAPANDEDDAEDDQDEDDAEDDQDDQLNFDDAPEEGDDEDLDFNVEEFNAKMKTNFKTAKEIRESLNKQDENKAPEEDDILREAEEQISTFESYIALDDYDLMEKQFTAIAAGQGKDLNNEDVKLDIQDQLSQLADSGKLELEAFKLKQKMKDDFLNPAKIKKTEIETKRAKEKALRETEEKEAVKNTLSEIFASNEFYGVDLDAKLINETYKDINSGKFEKDILSNKKDLVELALMWKTKNTIFEKASGLTYSDGLKSVLENYKSKKNSTDKVVNAQRVASSRGKKSTDEGLVSTLLKGHVVEGD